MLVCRNIYFYRFLEKTHVLHIENPQLRIESSLDSRSPCRKKQLFTPILRLITRELEVSLAYIPDAFSQKNQ